MRQHRLLSNSEIETALTCWFRWDLSYGGHILGSTLKPKSLLPILSEGRAWGAAVAALHASDGVLAPWEAHQGLRISLEKDRQAMLEAGAPDSDVGSVLELEGRLGQILDHYLATSPPLPGRLTRLEDPFEVGLPSRGGKHASTVYKLTGFLDGVTDEEWLVEYKLRRSFRPVKILERETQLRWYAWAVGEVRGIKPAGVLVDTRLNQAPQPARILKGGKVSHAKDQITTSEAYIAACLAHDEDPHDDVVEHLRSRVWQQRVPIIFRPGELEEAGRQLVSAAKLIRDLDRGDLEPIRNAKPANCNGCRFDSICSNPDDELYVDSLFTRTVPKRLREPEEVPA